MIGNDEFLDSEELLETLNGATTIVASTMAAEQNLHHCKELNETCIKRITKYLDCLDNETILSITKHIVTTVMYCNGAAVTNILLKTLAARRISIETIDSLFTETTQATASNASTATTQAIPPEIFNFLHDTYVSYSHVNDAENSENSAKSSEISAKITLLPLNAPASKFHTILLPYFANNENCLQTTVATGINVNKQSKEIQELIKFCMEDDEKSMLNYIKRNTCIEGEIKGNSAISSGINAKQQSGINAKQQSGINAKDPMQALKEMFVESSKIAGIISEIVIERLKTKLKYNYNKPAGSLLEATAFYAAIKCFDLIVGFGVLPVDDAVVIAACESGDETTIKHVYKHLDEKQLKMQTIKYCLEILFRTHSYTAITYLTHNSKLFRRCYNIIMYEIRTQFQIPYADLTAKSSSINSATSNAASNATTAKSSSVNFATTATTQCSDRYNRFVVNRNLLLLAANKFEGDMLHLIETKDAYDIVLNDIIDMFKTISYISIDMVNRCVSSLVKLNDKDTEETVEACRIGLIKAIKVDIEDSFNVFSPTYHRRNTEITDYLIEKLMELERDVFKPNISINMDDNTTVIVPKKDINKKYSTDFIVDFVTSDYFKHIVQQLVQLSGKAATTATATTTGDVNVKDVAFARNVSFQQIQFAKKYAKKLLIISSFKDLCKRYVDANKNLQHYIAAEKDCDRERDYYAEIYQKAIKEFNETDLSNSPLALAYYFYKQEWRILMKIRYDYTQTATMQTATMQTATMQTATMQTATIKRLQQVNFVITIDNFSKACVITPAFSNVSFTNQQPDTANNTPGVNAEIKQIDRQKLCQLLLPSNTEAIAIITKFADKYNYRRFGCYLQSNIKKVTKIIDEIYNYMFPSYSKIEEFATKSAYYGKQATIAKHDIEIFTKYFVSK